MENDLEWKKKIEIKYNIIYISWLHLEGLSCRHKPTENEARVWTNCNAVQTACKKWMTHAYLNSARADGL